MINSAVIIVAVAAATVVTGLRFEGLATAPRRVVGRTDPAPPVQRLTRRPPRSIVLRAVARLRPVPTASDEAVAAWCNAVARELRGGDSLAGALHTRAPEPGLERALAPLRLGLDRGAAVHEATARVITANDGLRRAVAVIRVTSTSGSGTAMGLDRVAASLRERCAVADERRAQSAQARLSAHVLTALPFAALALMAVTSSDLRQTLVGPVGAVCIPLGLGLNLLGWLWMRRILRGPR